MNKLCFIITDAISFNKLMRGQLEYLADKGYDLTLVCGGQIEQIELLKNRNVGKVKFIPFSRKINFILDIYCLLYLWLFLLFNRFDSIIYSTPKALLLSSIASFFSCSKNRICIFRGRVYENYSNRKFSLFKLLDKISINLSTRILFISNSLREKYINESLIDAKDAIVVAQGSSNGINVHYSIDSDFIIELDRIKKIINYKENDFIVVFLSRHCQEKGIEQWKKIYDNFKYSKIKFVSVGDIEDHISLNIINQLSIFDNYFYLGQINSVYPLLQIANVHLFLSYREGFGNVAIEAAVSGVPTLAYDVTGVRDSVNPISGKLFTFLEVDGIVEEILTLFESNLEKKFDVSLMKSWAIMNFNQNSVWHEYEKFYIKKNEKIY